MAISDQTPRAKLEDAIEAARKAEMALRAYTLTHNPSLAGAAQAAMVLARQAMQAL